MEVCDISRAEALCRACLTEASNMRPLYNKLDGENRTLFEVLSFVASINLSVNNKYPQQVCDECFTLMCKTDEFKRRCIKSDSYLKGAIDDGGAVSTLSNGVKVEDSVDKPNIEPYQCTICFEKFSSVNSLESHVVFGHYCATVSHKHTNEQTADVTVNVTDSNIESNINQSGYEVKEESDDFATATEIADYFDVGNSYSPDYKQEAYTHDIPFVCNTCGLTFTKERAFKYHIEKKCIDSVKHIRDVEFKKPISKRVKKKEDCSKCDASFSLRKTLRRHLREVHKEGTNETYHCSTCMRSFIRRSSYTSHMKMHESKDHIKFICNTCKREFMHQAHLDNHVLAVHTRDKGFNCETCNISFTTQECLDIHKETHKIEKKHQCKLCNKAFQMMSTLNEHMRTHTGERPHLCSICGRGFTQKNNLEQHVRRHKGLKPFKCEHCERGFVSKGELVAHTRKHSGAHPFVCDDCGKGFTTSSSLVKHRRIHTGERPYACDLCTMKFSASGTLKNHRRTHTGEKPYQCSHCEKAFVQRQDLVSHIRCHTGERPYVCTNCGQAFRKASALKTHVKIHVKEPQRDVNLSVLQGVNVLLSGIHDIGS